MIGPRLARSFRTLGLSILVSSLALFLLPGVGQAGGAPPANDDFADATAVTEPLPFTDSLNTAEATLEDDEPALGDECGFNVRKTVWYSYSPSGADAIVAANTFGSDFDTVLGVWEGTDLADLSLIGCNDDRQNLQSSVPFFAETGTEYRIQIGGYNGQSGDLEFKVRTITAGVIAGTVTDADTSDPIPGACAFVQDAAGFGGGAEAFANDLGEYQAVVRPGEYVVQFHDCERSSYIPEWYDDVTAEADATEIEVTADTVESGIDAALAPACPGWGWYSTSQILGTAGDDVLAGTSGRDVICGFAGNDEITGLAGNDVLLGGSGADELRGMAGNDRIYGQRGPDELFGGQGNDRLFGGRGRDRCNGGAGNDRLRSCEIQVG